MRKTSEPRLLEYDPSDFETPGLDELREHYDSSVPEHWYYDFRLKQPKILRYIDRMASPMIKWKREEDGSTTRTMEVEAVVRQEVQLTTTYPRARKPDHRPMYGPPLALLMGSTKKQRDDILSTNQLRKAIPDEAAAVAFVEKAIWGNDPICPRCGLTETVYRVKSGKPMPWRCRDCKRYFSVKVGTSMEESNLPLMTWIEAIYYMHSGRKGKSAVELSKTLGVSYDHTWFLMHRIRAAMKQTDEKLTGEVQADETLIGAKIPRMHARRKPRRFINRKGKLVRDSRANKVSVMGFRDNSRRIRLLVAPDHSDATFRNMVLKNVKPGKDTVLYTDGASAYQESKDFGYRHAYVTHSRGEYVRGEATTNAVENIWSNFKRMYVGTHHYMSFKHLQRYSDEMAYRHNSGPGNGLETIARVLLNMVGERLSYKELIADPTKASA